MVPTRCSTALSSTGVKVDLGNGDNIVIGGAGNNRITTGSGTDVVFGAGGAVTRDGSNNNALLYAQTIDETQGGNNIINTGTTGSAGCSPDIMAARDAQALPAEQRPLLSRPRLLGTRPRKEQHKQPAPVLEGHIKVLYRSCKMLLKL